MEIFFRRAGVLFHILEPHPHQRVLADGSRLGLALDGEGVDSVGKFGGQIVEGMLHDYLAVFLGESDFHQII